MLKALDISTSALVAQRVRMNTIAGNLANISSVRNEKGELKPYQERFVVFQPDEAPANQRWRDRREGQFRPYRNGRTRVSLPTRPSAGHQGGKWKGYVAYPNINMTEPVR